MTTKPNDATLEQRPSERIEQIGAEQNCRLDRATVLYLDERDAAVPAQTEAPKRRDEGPFQCFYCHGEVPEPMVCGDCYQKNKSAERSRVEGAAEAMPDGHLLCAKCGGCNTCSGSCGRPVCSGLCAPLAEPPSPVAGEPDTLVPGESSATSRLRDFIEEGGDVEKARRSLRILLGERRKLECALAEANARVNALAADLGELGSDEPGSCDTPEGAKAEARINARVAEANAAVANRVLDEIRIAASALDDTGLAFTWREAMTKALADVRDRFDPKGGEGG